MAKFLFTNAAGLSMVAFASYFDVYSHAHIFVGVDPWWNPAHLLLYAGFMVMAYGVAFYRPRNIAGKLSIVGVVIVAAAATFNEFWHRVLLFGNPLPEPFPVEPPHALLAVGFIVLGMGALLYPVHEAPVVSDAKSRAAVALTSGSLWLIMAGSAFYVGGAYASTPAYLFAVGAGSFAASLFLAYPAALTKRFGYTVLSYAWFLLVYYIFFLTPADGLPGGLAVVAVVDIAIVRGRVRGISSRLLVLPLVALAYGFVYYPILPAALTIALNAGLVASAVGVALEYGVERVVALSLRA